MLLMWHDTKDRRHFSPSFFLKNKNTNTPVTVVVSFRPFPFDFSWILADRNELLSFLIRILAKKKQHSNSLYSVGSYVCLCVLGNSSFSSTIDSFSFHMSSFKF